MNTKIVLSGINEDLIKKVAADYYLRPES